MAALTGVCAAIERASIDEAYIDVTAVGLRVPLNLSPKP
jgi:nucleotidyltransferase/DNA polymerase involved in DNA repair